jgi:hypothetical protein
MILHFIKRARKRAQKQLKITDTNQHIPINTGV